MPALNCASVVKYWLNHPVVGPAAVQCSDIHSLPYLESQATMQNRKVELQTQQLEHGVGALWTGPLWIDTFLSTERFWRPAFDNAQRDDVPSA